MRSRALFQTILNAESVSQNSLMIKSSYMHVKLIRVLQTFPSNVPQRLSRRPQRGTNLPWTILHVKHRNKDMERQESYLRRAATWSKGGRCVGLILGNQSQLLSHQINNNHVAQSGCSKSIILAFLSYCSLLSISSCKTP